MLNDAKLRGAKPRAKAYVRGAALSGIAAEGLWRNGSGIGSRTLPAWNMDAQGRDLLAAGDVLVIDEAGMVGTRQMHQLHNAGQSGYYPRGRTALHMTLPVPVSTLWNHYSYLIDHPS